MLKFDEICQQVEANDQDQQRPPWHITILRNITLNPLDIYLKHLANQAGYRANITMGEYNHLMQEALAAKTRLIHDKTDIVLLFVQLATLSPALTARFSTLSADEREEAIAQVMTYVTSLIVALRQRTAAPLVFHLFELPCYPESGLQDLAQQTGQFHTVNQLNQQIRQALSVYHDIYYVDPNVLLMRMGVSQFYDERFWHIGRQPYSLQAIEAIAQENGKILHAIKGLTKKCLVLDCDNTLWGGILGEEGLANIQLGHHYPGSAYLAFQQQLLNLYHQGVLLALCSKNNLADVEAVLDHHPHMQLRSKHIAAKQVNWRPKSENIIAISKQLNIDLSHMVLIDDSPFEIHWVKAQLPMVTTIPFEAEAPEQAVNTLLASGLFDTFSLTEEDIKRNRFYADENRRTRNRVNFTSIESYLKSLEMVLEIKPVEASAVKRIAQLTKRTNQFNLTTKRYSEQRIHELIEETCADVIGVRLKDRFGDLGMIGVAIVLYEQSIATIDSFLLSCRALSRGVEDALLNQLVAQISSRGIEEIWAPYYPTDKNSQVADFYTERGFKLLETSQAGDKFLYHYPVVLGEAREYPGVFHGKVKLGESV